MIYLLFTGLAVLAAFVVPVAVLLRDHSRLENNLRLQELQAFDCRDDVEWFLAREYSK